MKRLELIVDLEQIVENARAIRARIRPEVKLLAVVKANAYGHGADQVARALLNAGLADCFAVATPDEGAQLRENGILQTPIVVLGAANAEEAEISVRNDLSQAVYDEQGLNALYRAAMKLRKTALSHLKVDSGMSRIGVRDEKELAQLLDLWDARPEVKMTGMFTHFCAADSDAQFTQIQYERFQRMIAEVKKRGYSPLCHAAASTAMLDERYGFDMVRAGIALYGTGVAALKGIVRPAQTLVSRPVRVEWIQRGDTVGYSRRFTAQRPTRVMTVPCGYGDGYPRLLSGRAEVIVGGKRAPIIGNVCMDMLMVDVTEIGEIDMDAPVVLMGEQGAERITPDELAEKAQTIAYEIMLGFGQRVSRRWIEAKNQGRTKDEQYLGND